MLVPDARAFDRMSELTRDVARRKDRAGCLTHRRGESFTFGAADEFVDCNRQGGQ
jgi:hypothetical protein